jgi:8-oxo-dGTP diphosphatase
MSFKTPKITVDGIIKKENEILLIKRRNNPYKDCWALPGGYVEYNEKTDDAVIREVFEETGLLTKIVNLIGVYSDPNRDPRGHTISIVYELKIQTGLLIGGDDAYSPSFFNINNLPEKLSFDHKKIIFNYLKELK